MKRKTKLYFLGTLVLLFLSALVLGTHDTQKSTPQAQSTPAAEEISAEAIYNDVNEARHNAGVGALSMNPAAVTAAQQKCQDMVANDYYAHINPKTGMNGYKYTEEAIPAAIYVSENLNEGSLTTNQAFVDSWLNSPAHKAAMLDPKYTDTGLAVCHRPSLPATYTTVVQEFAQVPPAQQSSAQSSPTPSHCYTSYYPGVGTVTPSAVTNCY